VLHGLRESLAQLQVQVHYLPFLFFPFYTQGSHVALHVIKKGGHMNTVERFHICVETKNYNKIKEKYTGVNNILFDMVISGDITQ
jgi:hypothetical protein